jgi:hypothetical protein
MRESARPVAAARSPQPSKKRRTSFTKRDLMRAVEALQAAGLQVASIRIEPNGAILLIPGEPVPNSEPNPWDE